MTCHANQLCIEDLAALRGRMTRAKGYPRQWIDHFLWLARHAQDYPSYHTTALASASGNVTLENRPDEAAYGALAYLLTGGREFAAPLRDQLRSVAESIAVRETQDILQIHCWVESFPLARWLIFFDWVHDSGVFSPADLDYLTERFTYFIWTHTYQRLRARPLEGTPCNNQNAAMGFACAVGGYLFGLKYQSDKRMARVAELGVEHLVRFLTSFPRGGYSFEGSTYMDKVNALIIPLALEVVRSVTGVDLMDSREHASCATPRQVLTAIARLMTPSGLMLPWDNYGYELPLSAPAAAYLAQRTGDQTMLRMMTMQGLQHWPGNMAWGYEKTLWTLLFLPSDFDGVRPEPAQVAHLFNHAEPSIGAGAAGPAQRLHVYQMWDRSHALPMRAHFNPNSIVMTYDASPLLLDGACVEYAKAEVLAQPEYKRFRPDKAEMTSIGVGTVGLHNTIFLDDEPHYAPAHETQGKLVGADYAPDAALFEADVTECFNNRYDVQQLRRSTLVLGDDAVLIRDRIISSHERKVSWRAHVRDGVTQIGFTRFAVTTAEGVLLEVCTPQDATLEHVYWRGAMQNQKKVRLQLESSCHELTWSVTGADVTLVTLLVPTALRRVCIDLSTDWQWRCVKNEKEANALLDQGGNDPGMRALTLDRPWFYVDPVAGHPPLHEPGIGVYRRILNLDSLPHSPLWLCLPRILGEVRVWVNGRVFHLENTANTDNLLPRQIEISGALQEGVNTIGLMVASSLEWSLSGCIELREAVAAPPPARLVQVDTNRYELHHHGRILQVLWDEKGCQVQEDAKPTIQLHPREPESSDDATPPRMDAALESIHAAVERVTESPICDAATLAQVIAGSDWRSALKALEEAETCVDPLVIQAAWDRLKTESATHPTPYLRQPEDVCWYRVKAACARVLGKARHAPAADLLGRIMTGDDFYPVRSACAQALGRIATPEALRWLERVRDDEHNVSLSARIALKTLHPGHET